MDKLNHIRSIPVDKYTDIRNIPSKKINHEFAIVSFISLPLTIMRKNGYVNISKLIDDKIFTKYINDSYVVSQIENISKMTHIPINELIINDLLNISEQNIKGIYAHQKIFYLILMNFSPKFLEKSLNTIGSYFVEMELSDSESSSDSSYSSSSTPKSKSHTKTESRKIIIKTEAPKNPKTETPKIPKTEVPKFHPKTEIPNSLPVTEFKPTPKSKPKASEKKPPVKKITKRKPSEYQIFVGKRIGELRKSNPGHKHPEYMKMAAAEWTKLHPK
jgi:hypothetical protein